MLSNGTLTDAMLLRAMTYRSAMVVSPMVGTPLTNSPSLIETRVSANGIDFAVIECGIGPLALCLHGFPDSAHTWRHLLPALGAAGFRAVAPFMRGYSPTSLAPNGVYQTAALATDANALHTALAGDDTAVIIGHDWGAPSAYGAAILEPDKWRRVVGVSVPPWGAMGNAFFSNLTQLQRSWYMFVFQHPLADFVVSANDFAFIDLLWKQWSPGYASEVDRQHVKDALGDPRHLQAALGYYRATLGSGFRDPALADMQTAIQAETPSQPTLYLHGRDDGCIGVEVAQDATSRAPENCSVRIVEDAGHFLQLEQPAIVNELILDWITR
jgi:pimeloyl-ACP methyl ester carboxylesterase